MIKTIDENLETNKEGILIIIDEIHNLKDLSNAASIFRNIATSLDFEGRGKVSFLLIGYEEDVDRFFSIDESSRRVFDLKKLETMPDEEAIEILKKGFDAASITYDEEPLKGNVGVAGGYPHSIQILGHNLIETDTDNHINGDDWSRVIVQTALELQEKDFYKMYTFRRKQPERDKILQLLATENNPLSRKEINARGSIKNVYRCISDLKKLGAVKEDDDGKIHLQSQLFRVSILFDLAMRRITDNQRKKTEYRDKDEE